MYYIYIMHSSPTRFAASPAARDVQDPSAPGVDGPRLRAAMGHFATGVTVVTAGAHDGRPFGTTANAVSSVSLDPPLVLACLKRESETLAALRQRGRFAIHILDGSQRELAERFARRTESGTWDPVAHRFARDVPLLPGALATLQCDLHDTADGGDHEIVVGRVVDLELAPDDAVDPLIFFRGGFHRLSPPATAAADPAPTSLTEVALPSRRGPLRVLSLSDDIVDETSVAILTGAPRNRRGVLLYAHDGCVLGDALGGVCPRRERLDEALDLMEREGHGVAVYHRDAREPFGQCCFAGQARQRPDGSSHPDCTELSAATVTAAARAVAELGLSDVRVLASARDTERLARAGVPVGERPSLFDCAADSER